METPIWGADAPAHGDPYMGADAPAHGDPYMGCRCTCSWRPLYGVQMHLLMETPIWGADAPAHGCNDPYMGADAPGLACLWMHGDNNGDLCIWGVARGFMETPGYGVKMQWMHDPWVWGKDAVDAWRPWVRGEDAVNAWRPLGTG